MLTFFRRIRKALLDSGSTGKYLLYAIGEIALVVIGILIALQINNWNDWRKDRRTEQVYLANLMDELDSNLVLARSHIQFDTNQRNRANLILSVCANDVLLNDPIELIVSVEFAGWIYPLIYQRNVWSEMQNTGNIKLTSNQKVKRSLTDIYQDFDLYKELEVEFQSYNLGYRRLTGDVLSPKIRKSLVIGMGGPYKGELENRTATYALREKLEERNGLNGFLVDIQRVRGVSSRLMKEQIVKMEKAYHLVSEELDLSSLLIGK